MIKISTLTHTLLLTLTVMCGMTSCSESDDSHNEFEHWLPKNEQYFQNVYNQAIASATDDLDTIRCYSFNSGRLPEATDYIVVKKVKNGTGTAVPLYTDSVKVHYRGRYIPSPNYPEGYVFDQSYTGDYDPNIITPSQFAVSAVVDGFSTAVQHMRIGDRWTVYIPYQLGYGASDYTSSGSSSSIPGGSTLIFDITMVSFHHPASPSTRGMTKGEWVER